MGSNLGLYDAILAERMHKRSEPPEATTGLRCDWDGCPRPGHAHGAGAACLWHMGADDARKITPRLRDLGQ